MILRGKKGWLVAGVVILAGIASVPAVAGEGTEEDLFAALPVVADDDLEAARGGGNDTIIESFNTTITTTALNDVTATIGTITITAGSISGGPVTISDNALASFSGIVTQAFVTAPGSIATATTALTVTLIP